ncbi:MAG: efflux RND transporter periplasmic adaptor subunit [Candidatus Competibacteraceae bacterium]|nr:efflux RND transporter periplasmic adaptor subunit [Candidatus Competibacteraceae bacterium]
MASLFLVGAVSASVYDKLFVIPAESAFLTADVIMVTAPTAGVLSTLPPVGQEIVVHGSPIVGIDNGSSYGVTVDSPCNCRVVARKAKAGMYIKQGDTLLVLAPDTAKPYALAHLPPNQALALQNGAEVRVELGDGETAVPGTIREIRRHADLWATGQGNPGLWTPVEVVIEFGEDLPLSAIGAPLAVEFDTFKSSRLGRLLNGSSVGTVKPDETAVQSSPGNAS